MVAQGFQPIVNNVKLTLDMTCKPFTPNAPKGEIGTARGHGTTGQIDTCTPLVTQTGLPPVQPKTQQERDATLKAIRLGEAIAALDQEDRTTSNTDTDSENDNDFNFNVAPLDKGKPSGKPPTAKERRAAANAAVAAQKKAQKEAEKEAKKRAKAEQKATRGAKKAATRTQAGKPRSKRMLEQARFV